MRLIDADALIPMMKYATTDSEIGVFPIKIGFDAIVKVINAQPTIERKTGKWEIYVISPFDGEGCRCSECGFEGVPYWDFCPNCGAQMEVEHETD